MPHLLAHDYDQYAVERTTIATNDLVAWVGESEPKSITLFLDSCFSGQTRDSGTIVADARALRAGTGSTSTTSPKGRAAVLSAASGVGLSMSLEGVGRVQLRGDARAGGRGRRQPRPDDHAEGAGGVDGAGAAEARLDTQRPTAAELQRRRSKQCLVRLD